MHISDGVLSAPVWIGGYVVTVGIAAICSKKMKTEDMPKMAVMTSAFFVASLIHIPLGPTSVHLILNGLVGIILGPLSFISILTGLTLQAFLFQHGGITTIGANTIMMGIPALLSSRIFSLHKRFRFRLSETIFAGVAGASGVFLGTLILTALLVTTGSEFIGVAKYAALAHLPIMIIEAIITGFVVSFLMKVKPEILEGEAR
ncbi:MAG: cobalamin biosynthesis protein CbiM [bacterium (Candidatus Ratteibacteria) CG15_BIG_FIL_POST_REV_8_21_14_020_41_12]|uniref:Cobalamin biosynthesis protein CbiM n=2 Tax=Candidatus Ratteibacteria TaxID=2979319 RepID=A0A2M7H0L4_9BACT|nr:MAG: cobalamin biosynthesis protein CbiM [bacterium (Candidatus Ratteibacteria) CG15_BIG_FIL_POST_REV_8_21_14_020_41_12]